jgi:hypothetical protein
MAAYWIQMRVVPPVCVPAAVTLQQMCDLTLRRLREKPEERQSSTAAIYWSAINAAYPCRR